MSECGQGSGDRAVTEMTKPSALRKLTFYRRNEGFQLNSELLRKRSSSRTRELGRVWEEKGGGVIRQGTPERAIDGEETVQRATHEPQS